MKSIVKIFAILILVISVLSCVDSSQENASALVVFLSGKNRAVKASDYLSYYNVSVTSELYSTSQEKIIPGGAVEFKELPVGAYMVNVSAFTEGGVKIGEGEEPVIIDGSPQAVAITIHSLMESATFKERNTWFNSDAAGLQLSEVTTITFQIEPYTGDYSRSWDAGEVAGEITAYLNGTDVIVSSNYRKFVANTNSNYFFTTFTEDDSQDSDATTFMRLRSITGLNLWDTSNVQGMSNMFSHCRDLTSLDLSSFDTSNVQWFSRMFRYCQGLTSLDLSNFITSKIEWMSCLFLYCSSLVTLDISNFDTSKNNDFNHFFAECSSLRTIYAPDFSLESVQPYCDGYVFTNCTSLRGQISGMEYSDDRDTLDYANQGSGYFSVK